MGISTQQGVVSVLMHVSYRKIRDPADNHNSREAEVNLQHRLEALANNFSYPSLSLTVANGEWRSFEDGIVGLDGLTAPV